MKPKTGLKIALVFLIVLTVFFSIKTITAFFTSAAESKEVVIDYQTRSITYDYQVYPLVSTLYPEGTEPLPPGSKMYFSNLTEKVLVEVTGEINSNLAVDKSDFNIDLMVRSTDQWEKQLDYTPEVSVVDTDGGKKFHADINLPLSEAEAVAKAISDETDINTRSGFGLVIRSSLTANSLAGAEGETFTGEYEFIFNGSAIEPVGELYQEQNNEITENEPSANYMTLLGLPLKVSVGKVLFPCLTSLSLLLFAYLFYFRPKRQAGSETNKVKLEKINKRYGSRIVRANKLGEIKPVLKVEMEGFKELLRLAEERELPILQVSSDNPGKNIVQFYVIDDKALYSYSINIS